MKHLPPHHLHYHPHPHLSTAQLIQAPYQVQLYKPLLMGVAVNHGNCDGFTDATLSLVGGDSSTVAIPDKGYSIWWWWFRWCYTRHARWHSQLSCSQWSSLQQRPQHWWMLLRHWWHKLLLHSNSRWGSSCWSQTWFGFPEVHPCCQDQGQEKWKLQVRAQVACIPPG